ncbi:MAG: TIR domain-containing protein [Bacteroidota bacterium]
MPENEVFITYSWGSDAYNQKVIAFCNFLREKGFHATLDVEKAQGETALSFHVMMHQAMTDYDKVIVLLSEAYKKKAENFVGGVGFEYSMIIADIKRNRNKYILASFDGYKDSILPLGLDGRQVVDLSSESGLNELYAKLQGVAMHQFVPVGKNKPIVKSTLYNNFNRSPSSKIYHSKHQDILFVNHISDLVSNIPDDKYIETIKVSKYSQFMHIACPYFYDMLADYHLYVFGKDGALRNTIRYFDEGAKSELVMRPSGFKPESTTYQDVSKIAKRKNKFSFDNEGKIVAFETAYNTWLDRLVKLDIEKYEFRYDYHGRVSKFSFSETKEIRTNYEYSYKANLIEARISSSQGEGTIEYTLNEEGLIVKRVSSFFKPKETRDMRDVHNYKYEYDEYGNWIKVRIENDRRDVDVTSREITYVDKN